MQINVLENRCLLATQGAEDNGSLLSDQTFQDTLAEAIIQGPGFFEGFAHNPITKITETFVPALCGQVLKHTLDIHGGNGLGEAIFSNIMNQVATKSIITAATVPLDAKISETAQWDDFDEYAQDYRFQNSTEAVIKLGMTAVGNSIIHYAVRPFVGSLVKSYGGIALEAVLPGSGEVIKPVLSGVMNFIIPWTAAKITTIVVQNGLLSGADWATDYLNA